MRESDNYPRVDRNAQIDAIAVNAIKRVFQREGGHLVEDTTPDKGRDHRLIFVDKERARGFSTGLQVKGTESIDTTSSRAFRYTLRVANIQFLTDSPEPAYYLVYDVRTDRCYYREAHELAWFLDQCRPEWRTQKTVTVQISTSRRLGACPGIPQISFCVM